MKDKSERAKAHLYFLSTLVLFLSGKSDKESVRKAYSEYTDQGDSRHKSHLSGASVRPRHNIHREHFGTFSPMPRVPRVKPDQFGRLCLSPKWSRKKASQ